MSDWVRIPLDELVDVIDPHPSHRAPDAVVQGIAFIGIGDIREDGSLIEGKGRIVSEKIFDEHIQRYQISDRTIGFGRVATIGKVISFQNPTTKFVVSPTMAVLEPKPGTNRDFILHALRSEDIQEQIDKLLTGSTRSSLGIELLRKLTILHPATAVAKKISKVLNSVSSQIDATQALIDKYTAIKQGMMADLFSRGIDPETKALRPTFEEAPNLYHETPLGMLPKGWKIETLGEAINGPGFIQTGPFGSQLHAYDYVDSGVPVVMPQDIVQGRISTEKIAYITERKASELSRHKLKLNDVIFSRRGDLTRSSFVDVQNGYEGFLCGTGCLLMRVDPSNIVGGWFSYLYGSDLVQRQVEGLAVGTTMPNLNSSILKKLIIPFPSVEEQTQIFSAIASAQSFIDESAKQLEKLIAQKTGLMQDLLTGKVPAPA